MPSHQFTSTLPSKEEPKARPYNHTDTWTSSVMSNQACHFLRLPLELRLMVYDYVFNTQVEVTLVHPLSHISEQISDEVMPILIRRSSGFFWTAIACDEEWYLAIQPFKEIWRMRLTNAAEKPLDATPAL
ncbi:hypothetical protein QM012_008812 [Aureobasidium pullulans]|uniref:F-box domain-containing protein n=1 Tax=Aureobasidium pullulans TaxID=5580 RepID=A0ABR0THQ7_AURPU